ncbi:MAG: threonylcarbamoyl-AMP synthase [Candidatus Marinimicrobia bacterium]|nr:threonylcarbamoyl-AMP synthase [Candidatus Neomarinimicrobiota bacterium]
MIILDLKHRSTTLSGPDAAQITQLLHNDQVIVYPTDTLYGLGVDASSEAAVARLYRLKAREDSPISVLLESVAQLFDLADGLNETARILIQKFLPGALTVVCKCHYPFARQLMSRSATMGFRVPGDAISRQIPELNGRPVTTTSVNPAGFPAATSLEEVQSYFADELGMMLNMGTLRASRGSTVIDLTTQPFEILREGEIARQALQEFLN